MRWMIGPAMLALAAAPAGSQPADEAAAARFLAATGHRLAGPEPTAAELAPIVAKLAGARVIGLGEVTHGTHEDVAFKARLLRELVKAGAIDTLAIEANRVVGLGFDRYIREGIGDPAALVMSPSAFKIFKNDEFAGALLWLRAWNLAHPDRMVGVVAIDDQDGAVDAAFALGVLARHDAALAAKLRAALGTMIPPPGAPRLRPSDWIAERTPADVARVLAAAAALRDAFSAHASEWSGDPEVAEAAYAAKLVWQNIRVFELDVKGSTEQGRAPEVWSRRDRFMADNLVERLGAGRRAALWAHNDHVIHTYPAEWTRQGYTALGVEVKRRLGAAYRTLGFTYTRAAITAVRGHDVDLKQLVAEQRDETIVLDNGVANTSGQVLARLPGDVWWFDTAAPAPDAGARRWLERPTWNGNVGWIVDPAKFQTSNVLEDTTPVEMGFDVLVWFRALTPQHRWPVAPPPPKP